MLIRVSRTPEGRDKRSLLAACDGIDVGVGDKTVGDRDGANVWLGELAVSVTGCAEIVVGAAESLCLDVGLDVVGARDG